jgi:hypothetical protein
MIGILPSMFDYPFLALYLSLLNTFVSIFIVFVTSTFFKIAKNFAHQKLSNHLNY